VSLRTKGILREMGLAPLWRLRSVEEIAVEEPATVLSLSDEASGAPAVVPVVAKPLVARQVEARSALREALAPLAPVLDAAAPRREISVDLASLGWDELEERIRACDACGLCKRRKQAVPGVGDRQADWLFVGEGPGAEEDERGEPFVGQAGRLLDNMLGAIDLKRGEDVYIANAVKCRPPNNRTPEATELAACFPYLSRQIELIRPRLIVALGRPAAQALLNQEIKIGAVRGKLFSHASIPVVVTYHPAYLLRNMADKAKAWEDLCFARNTMRHLRDGE
jgi:uracil-DNA glycosylase